MRSQHEIHPDEIPSYDPIKSPSNAIKSPLNPIELIMIHPYTYIYIYIMCIYICIYICIYVYMYIYMYYIYCIHRDVLIFAILRVNILGFPHYMTLQEFQIG